MVSYLNYKGKHGVKVHDYMSYSTSAATLPASSYQKLSNSPAAYHAWVTTMETRLSLSAPGLLRVGMEHRKPQPNTAKAARLLPTPQALRHRCYDQGSQTGAEEEPLVLTGQKVTAHCSPATASTHRSSTWHANYFLHSVWVNRSSCR